MKYLDLYTQLLHEQNNPGKEYGHFRHFEDLLFYSGYDGFKAGIKALYGIRNNSSAVSIKWDGSPSIFFGKDPSDSQFFVATKSIFSTKTPKLIKSKNDLSVHYPDGGDLPLKLWSAYECLKTAQYENPGMIYQGDMLFGSRKKKYKIGSKSYIGFHANTLIYAYPKGSSEAQELLNSSCGISLYASWSGSSLNTMIPDYKPQNISGPSLWIVDPYIENIQISDSEFKDKLKEFLNSAQALTKALNTLSQSEIAGFSEKYYNSLIRNGYLPSSSMELFTRYKKYASENNKNISILSDKEWIALFDLHMRVANYKNEILNDILNSIPYEGLEVFAQRKDTKVYNETGHEGLVVASKYLAPFKLINRLEFSSYNFDDENISRGWTKKK